ncbi:MAG: AAA family ATPase [Verrucomicrobiales bacterium]
MSTAESEKTPAALEKKAQSLKNDFQALKAELSRAMVGQDEVLRAVLVSLFAGGHVLLEGVPGLGKTHLVRCLSDVCSLTFSRIQFTPDLMPADVLGTNVLVEEPGVGRHLQFQAGPIFTHLLLADEINRATPKTQSALLEAMQEKQVTAGGVLYRIEEPFLVLGTQNPLEMEGTFPLPEAQLDRFFFRVPIHFPGPEDLHKILELTTSFEIPQLKVVCDGDSLMAHRKLLQQIPVTRDIRTQAIQLVLATHPERPEAIDLVQRFVRYGASPRGAQALIQAAKIHALIDDRFHVSRADLLWAAPYALHHRILLNFEALAEGITPDAIIQDLTKRHVSANK